MSRPALYHSNDNKSFNGRPRMRRSSYRSLSLSEVLLLRSVWLAVSLERLDYLSYPRGDFGSGCMKQYDLRGGLSVLLLLLLLLLLFLWL